ncbi:myelin-associated glycoprotein isoform X2 [Mastacembelus armatus]|uniref:Si:dkey-238d18.5 n=1 Tax=Mastacembelus armatus TaxID=205130 RepID=A0A7N8X993_9TELE|nr:myelin-associated glycoprotein-like isoform X2 [Mastacembelus armatus]
MFILKRALLFVCFCFTVARSEASSWTVTVPQSVRGVLGSCVVISCKYDFPHTTNKITGYTGIWYKDTDQVIYHPQTSNIIENYRSRTELLGNLEQKNCSLKINSLQQSDQGSFYFRIEIGGHDKYTHSNHKVSITVDSEPALSITVKEELEEGQTVSASCSASHFYPACPPTITWTHSGQSQLQLHDAQWKSTLTFQPTPEDHNKALGCTVTYKDKQMKKASSSLKVKYAPVKVNVAYNRQVKEGQDVQLTCSSDANPPASTYTWTNATGAQLYQKNPYTLSNVSRHTGTIYCSAKNTVGQRKSSPVQLNVLYAPEIKAASCSSEVDMVKCVCIVESNPPSKVHFNLLNRVLPSTSLKNDHHVTNATLLTKFEASEFIQCWANNTLGNAERKMPLSDKMMGVYIFIIAGACVILVILLIIVAVVKICRRSPAPQMSDTQEGKTVEPPPFASTYRKEMDNEDKYSFVYGNDQIYSNVGVEDEAIYANM